MGGRVTLAWTVVAVTLCVAAPPSGTFALPAEPEQLAVPGEYRPLVPARLLDTREGRSTVDGVAATSARLGPDAAVDVPVLGRAGIPATGVSAVVLNVTATEPTASSYLTVWPTGHARPTASNLNFVAGQTVPNLVIAKVGAGGKVTVYNRHGQVDVLADVAGYFPQTDPFVPLIPARLLDTRAEATTVDGSGRPAVPLSENGLLDLPVLGRGGVPPTGVDAVVLNVTATNVTASSFVTVWPTGQPRPTASNINMTPDATVPNLVIAKVGDHGSVSVFNRAGTADIVADVAGYFPSDGAFVSLTPARIMETREGQPVTVGGRNEGLRLAAGSDVDLPVTGVGGVPERGVAAVVLNVTAVNPGQPAFVTVSPSGVDRPTASNLNLIRPGQVIANLVVAKVGAGGHVSIHLSHGTTDMAIDVAGYFLAERSDVVQVSSSDRSACARSDVGTVTCWGQRSQDVVLFPNSYEDPSPQEEPMFDDVLDVAIGSVHTCVLRMTLGVHCWGRNLQGQVGDGTTDLRWPPVKVGGLEPIVDIDAGTLQTCGVTLAGTVACWGAWTMTGAPQPVPVVVPGLADVVKVSVGERVVCALHEVGTVSCWGVYGSLGMLGDGSGEDSATPVAVSGVSDAVDVNVMATKACAVRANGEAQCWGNSFLGNGTVGRSLVPVAVLDAATGQPATNIVQLVGGGDYLCALRTDGRVYCLGSAQAGVLGLSPATSQDATMLTAPVGGLDDVISIGGDGHGAFVCAVLATEVVCWGFNGFGQLGDGSFVDSAEPVTVALWR